MLAICCVRIGPSGKKHRPKFEWSFTGSGLAGDAYFRTAAVLDAFSDAAIADLNMTEIEILESKRVFSSDFMMPVVLAARGYTYAPWRDITQFDLRGDPDKKFLTDQPIEAALQHYGRGVPGGKPTYNLKLTPEMEGLYTTGKWATKSVVCHRCYTYDHLFCLSVSGRHLAVVPYIDGASSRLSRRSALSLCGGLAGSLVFLSLSLFPFLSRLRRGCCSTCGSPCTFLAARYVPC